MVKNGSNFSNRLSRDSLSSPSTSVFRSIEQKNYQSLYEELERLHLRLSSVNGQTMDKDENCDNTTMESSVAQLEVALEGLIVDIIANGHSDLLKPNSGTAVAVEDYHVCVSCTEDRTSQQRMWEWHGHIMVFHEGEGYVPEYVYGNFSENTQMEEDYCFRVGFGLGQIIGEANEKVVTKLR